MPLWSIIYLVLFVAGIAIGIFQDFREHSDKRVVLVLDAVTLIICAYLFVSFWILSWREQAGVVALPVYIAAVGWQVWTLPQGLRKVVANPKVPNQFKKPLAFVAIGVWIAPAVIVAGMAAFR
jgi:hypothetical protein